MNRRNFLKTIVVSAASAPLLYFSRPFTAFSADLPFAKEGAKLPVQQFCTDADKAIKAKKPGCPDRKKPERKDQYCSSCQLFQGTREKTATGKCLVMPQFMVHGNDWCNSYVQKV